MLAAVAVLLLCWLLLTFLWLHRPCRELVRPTLRILPDLVRLVRALIADRSTPWRVRLALLGLLACLLTPLDLVPDVLPGLEGLRAGWTGDSAGFELLRRLLGL